MRLVTCGSPLLQYKKVLSKSIHICLLSALPRRRVKLEEGVFQGIVKLHDGGLVATPVAVVGGGEDGDDVPVVRPVVPLHDELMSSANQGQTIRMVECLRNILKTEAFNVTSAVQFFANIWQGRITLLIRRRVGV